MSQYFIYYTESNLVCVILFGIMLARDLLSVDRQEKQIKYDHALIAFTLYFISDATWASVIAGMLPRNRFTVVTTNFANYIFMAAVTYSWLDYVMVVEQVAHRERRINKFAVIFPFLVSSIALVATYIFAPQVLLSDALELRPAYNIFLVTVPFIYIVAVIIYTMRRAKNEANPIEKRRHLYIGMFPLIVIAGGMFQLLVLPSTPIFCFSCTILMLIFYIHSMEAQISIDPLTQLNNRGQLIRYVAQESNLRKEDRSTFVMMLDANNFKSINDTYGHAEGDRALVILADSLRKVVRQRSVPVFLARYGGDEFIIIAHLPDSSVLDALIADIRAEITERCRAEGTPYTLAVGIGYDRLAGGQDTFQKCLQRADHKLYLDKEYCKSHGQTTICA